MRTAVRFPKMAYFGGLNLFLHGALNGVSSIQTDYIKSKYHCKHCLSTVPIMSTLYFRLLLVVACNHCDKYDWWFHWMQLSALFHAHYIRLHHNGCINRFRWCICMVATESVPVDTYHTFPL